MAQKGIDIEKQVGDFLGDKPAEGEGNSFDLDNEDFDADIRNPPEEEEEVDEEAVEVEKTRREALTEEERELEDKKKDDDDDDDDDPIKIEETRRAALTEEERVAEDVDKAPEKKEEKVVDPEMVALKAQLLEQDRQLKELLAKLDPEKKVEKPKIKDEVHTFVTDEDIDDVLADAGKFNAMMSKAITAAVQQAVGHVTDTIPGAVSGVVTQQFDIRDYVKTFYEENTDLVGVKKTVGTLANEVQAANPDWTLNQIFTETAKKTREALGMPELGAKQEESKDTVKPKKKTEKSALPPGGKGSRKGVSKSSGLQGEINALL